MKFWTVSIHIPAGKSPATGEELPDANETLLAVKAEDEWKARTMAMLRTKHKPQGREVQFPVVKEVDREALYCEAFESAMSTLEMLPELEPTSALKQAGSNVGLEYGADMEDFVTWAHQQF